MGDHCSDQLGNEVCACCQRQVQPEQLHSDPTKETPGATRTTLDTSAILEIVSGVLPRGFLKIYFFPAPKSLLPFLISQQLI